MEWAEFIGWLAVMRKQTEPAVLEPDSWAGYDQDPWYQEQRRKRDEARADR